MKLEMEKLLEGKRKRCLNKLIRMCILDYNKEGKNKTLNLNIKLKDKNYVEFLFLIVITCAIWSYALFYHHIYPFGTNMMDISDMTQQSVPMYTYLWDILHGGKNLFFDWQTGLGDNMCGANWHFGNISPFNIFFLFIPRGWIEASMSIYVLIKLICISIGTDMVFSKWFSNLSSIMRISFCLLYTFSAFNLQYYYTPMWLDVAFMFPIVMYFYFKVIQEKKCTGYTISLAIACMMSFQHTYMLALMLVFLTGIIMLLEKKSIRRR